MAVKQKRRITADDLYKLQLITYAEISPDGRYVIYCVQRVDPKTEKKYSNLWIVSTEDKSGWQFTYGNHVDREPHWSPDGMEIAFLSNRADENQFQIYIISIKGGEARPLTNLSGEIEMFRWSPDGKKFVLQHRKMDQEAEERKKNEDKKKLGIVYRQIDRLFYKLDGYGYLPKERWHIWVVDSRTGKATALTNDPIYDDLEPNWSTDSKHIIYCSNHSEQPDIDFEAIDLFVLPLTGGTPQKFITPEGPKSLPTYSPNGKWIAYLGRDGKGDEWKNTNLWIAPVDGSEPPRNLTGGLDIHTTSWTINDLGSPTQMAPTWDQDGQRIYFQVARHGKTLLCSIQKDGTGYQTEIDQPGVVGAYTFDRSYDKLVYFWGTMMDPGQLMLTDLKSHTTISLTRVNSELLDALDLGQIDEYWFKGPDDNDLQGWILKPPEFTETQKYPSILEIHGGPLVQYGYFFMHEFFYLAAQGYVVYFCNPRGGQGYGEKHSGAIANGKWGTADYQDLMAWTDFVEKLSYIDPLRMGVTGGSYGGYMTNWIIGHTTRYHAAVTQRCVSNLLSMWGSSDFNWSFQETFDNKAPYENIEVLWECSPMKYIGNARTPTMVIHSEQDLRCPIEQGEQVYVALKKLGVDTEFIVFPDSPHGLSRTGRTDRRIQRLKSIGRWFDQYLK